MSSSSIFDWTKLIAENLWLYGGAFLLVLSLLVFIHEWGHYIVARMCGVKIETFSIGFGKEIFGFTDKKGTRWKFSMVPLGGYVQMFGDANPASAGSAKNVKDGQSSAQDVRPMTEAEKSVAFYAKPVAQRFAIVLAGPAINYLFAIVVLAGLFIFYGQPVTPPRASAIMSDSAAARAGFQPHDEVIAIDGKKMKRFEDLRRDVMVGLDEERIFTVLRHGEEIDIKAIPDRREEEDHFGFKHSRGLLGLISPGNAIQIENITAIDGKSYTDVDDVRAALIRKMGMVFEIELDRGPEKDLLIVQPLADMNAEINNPENPLTYNLLAVGDIGGDAYIKYGPAEAVVEALRETWDVTTSTLGALGQMVVGTRSATELGGMIRIGAFAGDMAKSGTLALISFMALLSINLGLINLFPIPMLDGGHLLFYTVEIAKGSPISEQIQEYAFRLGLAFLVGIMIFANLNDIVQLIL